VSVSSRLKDKGELDRVGGPVFVASLCDSTASSANIESHARIVKDKSYAREAIVKAEEVITKARNPLTRPEDIPTRLSIARDQKIDISHVSTITKRLNENISKGYRGLPPCYNVLAKTIRKLSPGHLIVVGAWTSTGKTAWLVDLICRLYRTSSNPGIAIFSTEMSKEQYLLRCLSNETCIPSWYITENRLKPEQSEFIIGAQKHFSSRNLYLYDTLYKIEDIEQTVRMIKDQKGLDIIAIDYLQNLWGEGKLYDRMSRLAPILQYLAKELEVTIIALSQVSNEHAKGESGGLINYKGAGEIAASADLGIELERQKTDKDFLNFIIKKNRHGKLGEGVLQYVGEYTRFKEIVEEEEDY
jgi:replicative DNA helicase